MIDTGQVLCISDIQARQSARIRREDDPIIKECRQTLSRLRREDEPNTETIIAVKKRLLERMAMY